MRTLDRDQVGEVGRILKIDERCRDDGAESGRRRVGADAQNPSDCAGRDQIMCPPNDRAAAQLKSDRGVNASPASRFCHLLRLCHAAAERPLTVDVHAGGDCGEHQFAVVRNPGRNRDQVDATSTDQIHATTISGR